MTPLTSWSSFTKLAILGALTWACSEEAGDKGNLAGAGNDEKPGSAGAPSTEGPDDEKPAPEPEQPKKPEPEKPEKPDELDASCDPEQLPFGGGEGTEESPYLLCATTQIEQMSEQFIANDSARTAHYSLTRSLDYRGYTTTPIGWHEDVFRHFEGLFDGRGHSISNFKISYPDIRVGFFASLGFNGRITNLSLKEATVLGISRVGGLVGESRGVVSNCHFQGEVTARGSLYIQGRYAGGLVGRVEGSETQRSRISDSSSSGSVRGAQDVGGLVGEATFLRLSKFSSNSNVTSTGNVVGGLIGSLRNGDAELGAATGNVMGNEQTGGAFGFTKDSLLSSIKASGDVKGTTFTGGVVGWADLSSRWTRSQAHGNVEGTRAVGGFSGASTQSHFQHSWASGSVRGVTVVGGFIGEVGSKSSASTVYSLGDVYGEEDTGGLLGRTMQVIGDFAFNYALGRLHFTGEGEPQNFGGLCGVAGDPTSIQYSHFFDDNYDNGLGTLLTQAEFGTKDSFPLWSFETAWELDTKAEPFARPVLR